MAPNFPQIGQSVKFAKTISESDIYLFAGITGDLSPNHVNEEFMKHSKYGRRIAHGALLVGFMSTASSLMIEKSQAEIVDATPVSLGYDRIRFIEPVFINSTICVTYTIRSVDPERSRTLAAIEVHDQDGALVAVAEHVLKWVANKGAPSPGA